MNIFRFKQFAVHNERSAMKVNTDGVLLGAFAGISPTYRRILDVGTGTGTIALMLAQRIATIKVDGDWEVLGIDTDEPSAEEADLNFRASPWTSRLHARCQAMNDCTGRFDLIVCNPPYFKDSLPAPHPRRSAARHARGLSFVSLLEFASYSLEHDGGLSLILPAEQENALLHHAHSFGLFPKRLTRVSSTFTKLPYRIMVEFTRSRCDCAENALSIRDDEGYTEAYISLVKDFYLWA